MNEKPDNLTFAHVCAMIIAITLCAVCISISVGTAKSNYRYTHGNYVKEYATIVRYELSNGRYDFDKSYTTFYEYEADGGVYYGMWQRLIYDEEDAKAQVGKKVPIYVDHTAKHHTKSLEVSTAQIWIAAAVALVSFLLFINSFVRETIFIIRWRKYKKASSTQNSR